MDLTGDDPLLERDFAYLLLYPSGLADLVRAAERRGVRFPGLRGVWTFGEVVTPEPRAIILEAWGLTIDDVYSTQELGYVALQRPGHDHYHVQSETVLLEVLREDGTPCEVREVGRLVLTSSGGCTRPSRPAAAAGSGSPSASTACAIFVPERPPTEAETEAVRAMFLAALPAGTAVAVHWVDEIPRTASGKFLDFVSELPAS